MQPMNERPLRVVPNPYRSLDARGRLAGACQLDPAFAAGSLRYIGATCEGKILEKRGGTITMKGPGGRPVRVEVADPRGSSRQDTWWTFDLTSRDIPDSPYHRLRLRSNEILVADEVTHRAVFGASRPFVPVEQALAAERQRAIEAFRREHDGADPEFLAAEEAAAPAEVPAAKPDKPAQKASDGGKTR